jgi:hypothetical protein
MRSLHVKSTGQSERCSSTFFPGGRRMWQASNEYFVPATEPLLFIYVRHSVSLA